ncbi:MAG: histidine phosphatase family protein [Gammaproteobacteria bacterium]|nr:histidine phosphatase family protein [Gammaproteobacteria bacterium]
MTPPTIYIARHASPDWSRTDIAYDRPPGPPLTTLGEKEAHALGTYLHSCGVSLIYASPLERAWRTAELVAEVIGIQPQVEDAIAEWRKDETRDVVAERVMGFWRRVVVETKKSGPICLVTHGGPMRLILNRLGVTSEQLRPFTERFDHNNPAPPAGLWCAIQATTEDRWELNLAFTPDQET